MDLKRKHPNLPSCGGEGGIEDDRRKGGSGGGRVGLGGLEDRGRARWGQGEGGG